MASVGSSTDGGRKKGTPKKTKQRFGSPMKRTKRFNHYIEVVQRSKGFDVPSESEVYSDESDSDDDGIGGGIYKSKEPMGEGSYLWKCAEFAVDTRNKETGSNLKLVKIIKANGQLVSGNFEYITLEANDNKTYRAKVFVSLNGNMELEIFNTV